MKTLYCFLIACSIICSIAYAESHLTAYVINDFMGYNDLVKPGKDLTITPYQKIINGKKVWAWRIMPDRQTKQTNFFVNIYIPDVALQNGTRMELLSAFQSHLLPRTSGASPHVNVRMMINGTSLLTTTLDDEKIFYWRGMPVCDAAGGIDVTLEISFPSSDAQCAVDWIMPQLLRIEKKDTPDEAALYFGRETQGTNAMALTWRIPHGSDKRWVKTDTLSYAPVLSLTRITTRERNNYIKKPIHLNIEFYNRGGKEYVCDSNKVIKLIIPNTFGVVADDINSKPIPTTPAHSWSIQQWTVFPHHHMTIVSGLVIDTVHFVTNEIVYRLQHNATALKKPTTEQTWDRTAIRNPPFIISDWNISNMHIRFIEGIGGMQDIQIMRHKDTWTTSARVVPYMEVAYVFSGTYYRVEIPARRVSYNTLRGESVNIRGWGTDAHRRIWSFDQEWKPVAGEPRLSIKTTINPPRNNPTAACTVPIVELPNKGKTGVYIPSYRYDYNKIPEAYTGVYVYARYMRLPVNDQLLAQASLQSDETMVSLGYSSSNDPTDTAQSLISWKPETPNISAGNENNCMALSTYVTPCSSNVTFTTDIRLENGVTKPENVLDVPEIKHSLHMELAQEWQEIIDTYMNTYTNVLYGGKPCVIAPWLGGPKVPRPEFLALLWAHNQYTAQTNDTSEMMQLLDTWCDTRTCNQWATSLAASEYSPAALFGSWELLCGNPFNIYDAAEPVCASFTNKYAWVFGETVQPHHLLERETLFTLAEDAHRMLIASGLCNNHYTRKMALRILTLLQQLPTPHEVNSHSASLRACAALIEAHSTAFEMTQDYDFRVEALKWGRIAHFFFRKARDQNYLEEYLAYGKLGVPKREPLHEEKPSPYATVRIAYAFTQLSQIEPDNPTWKTSAQALLTTLKKWYLDNAYKGCIPNALDVAMEEIRWYAPDMLWLLQLQCDGVSPAMGVHKLRMANKNPIFVCGVGGITVSPFPLEKRYVLKISYNTSTNMRMLIVNLPPHMKDIFANEQKLEESSDQKVTHRWRNIWERRTTVVWFYHTAPESTLELFY